MNKAALSSLTIILGLSFMLPPAKGQSATPLSMEFDRLIDSNYKQNAPGGVVLVTKNGQVIYERAFGMANIELNVPMHKNAVFCIASMTKQFTAVAILQQVELGKLSLDDTVGKFLPTLPAALHGITIEQLLTHTAGVPNAKSVNSLRAVGRGWLTADQVTSTFKDQPLDFAPGSKWAYSNSGYQLLGYILEKVTGEPYAEFMEKAILKPAGMDHSFYGNDMRVVPNRVSSYIYTRRGIENAVNDNVQIAFSAGALQSTAQDFAQWYRTLLSGKLIKKATLLKAWSPVRLSDGSLTDSGYGWFIGELQGSPVVEHGGNMGGFMSHAIYLPKEDILVCVFFNFRERLPELLAADLASMMIGRPLNMNAVALPDELLRSYTGVYKNAQNIDSVVSMENGTLFYQRTGGPKWKLIPYAKDKLFFDNTSTIGEIQRDKNGAITAFAMQTTRGTFKNVITRTASPISPP